jgi:metal-responsive CopG/Arc/MetJ family transcriptional regulator
MNMGIKRVTFSCPEELLSKIDSSCVETEAISPNGLKIKFKPTRSDLIVTALQKYIEILDNTEESEGVKI